VDDLAPTLFFDRSQGTVFSLGREFADYVKQYLPMIREQAVSIGMVLQNPEKSKHLETATLRDNQLWLDLVNLRAEQYAPGSRIPDVMRIGTAEEDAFRRDLTTNALFYNIQTDQVED
jgi:tRNA nucleotidyltransferase/poly(A) polymerase